MEDSGWKIRDGRFGIEDSGWKMRASDSGKVGYRFYDGAVTCGRIL